MSIADELITRGWAQGFSERDDGSVCLRGAAAHATTGDILGAYDLPRPVDVALRKATGTKFIATWNDAYARTFDEVLRAAKEADEILDASR